MCGIVGFFSKNTNKEHISLLKRLLVESSIRGMHSYGISYVVEDSIETIKSLELKQIIESLPTSGGIIFHSRYSTCYGDYKNLINAQPIEVEGSISIAINGVISMKPKEEYEKEYDVKCISDNDAEIFARALQKGITPNEFLSMPCGSIAAVYIKNNNIYAIRNNYRPLHWFNFKDSAYVVSTKDVVVRACKTIGIQCPIVGIIKPGKEICLQNLL